MIFYSLKIVKITSFKSPNFHHGKIHGYAFIASPNHNIKFKRESLQKNLLNLCIVTSVSFYLHTS